MKQLVIIILSLIITLALPYYVLAIEVGDKLPIEAKEAGYHHMIASAQISKAYSIEAEGFSYIVTIDQVSLINYISPTDKSFMTPEGIKVGDSYEKVKTSSTKPLIREPGWAFYVELPSGWKAAFVQGKTATEGELSTDAQVMWLFKR